MDYFDSNFTWGNTPNDLTLITGGTYALTVTATSGSYQSIIPDKDWMPYRHFEYEPEWHQKFARYKIQIEKMWN